MSETRAPRSVVVIAVCALFAGSLEAQEAVDPLIAAGTSDPIELARVVDRIGDGAVVARLAEEGPPATRLAAVHACGGMHAPEAALEALAGIAGSRDPDLAPAAAMALLGIARGLDPQELDSRDVVREELAGARAAIARVSEDETARGDVRRAAAIALDALVVLGVPAL